MTGQFVPVKINAEKEGVDVAKKYHVQGFPTILFINGEGEIENKIVGYLPPAGFSDQLTQIEQAHKDFPALQDRFKANPKDVEAAAKLAAIYAVRDDADHATTVLAQAEKLDPQNRKGYLTKAYNAVGDMYQNDQKLDKAIPFFRKAIQTGQMPADIAYAHLSIAVCYLMQHKISDAVPELKTTAAMANAPKDLKQQAQQILEQIQKQQSGGKGGK